MPVAGLKRFSFTLSLSCHFECVFLKCISPSPPPFGKYGDWIHFSSLYVCHIPLGHKFAKQSLLLLQKSKLTFAILRECYTFRNNNDIGARAQALSWLQELLVRSCAYVARVCACVKRAIVHSKHNGLNGFIASNCVCI